MWKACITLCLALYRRFLKRQHCHIILNLAKPRLNLDMQQSYSVSTQHKSSLTKLLVIIYWSRNSGILEKPCTCSAYSLYKPSLVHPKRETGWTSGTFYEATTLWNITVQFQFSAAPKFVEPHRHLARHGAVLQQLLKLVSVNSTCIHMHGCWPLGFPAVDNTMHMAAEHRCHASQQNGCFKQEPTVAVRVCGCNQLTHIRRPAKCPLQVGSIQKAIFVLQRTSLAAAKPNL